MDTATARRTRGKSSTASPKDNGSSCRDRPRGPTSVCFVTMPADVLDQYALDQSGRLDGQHDQSWFNSHPLEARRTRRASLLEHDAFELAQGTEVDVVLLIDGSHVRLFVQPRLSSDSGAVREPAESGSDSNHG